MKHWQFMAIVAVAFALSGCVTMSQQPQTTSEIYDRGEVLRPGTVREGIVVSGRAVKVQPAGDWAYSAAGATAGAAIGDRATNHRSGATRAATMAVATLVGAKIGDLTARAVHAESATELIVQTKDGPVVVVQPGASPAPGQAVYVLGSGTATRVIAKR